MKKWQDGKNKILNWAMLIVILLNTVSVLVGPLTTVTAVTRKDVFLGNFGDSAGDTQAVYWSGNNNVGVDKQIMYDGIEIERSAKQPNEISLGAYWSNLSNDSRYYCTWQGRSIKKWPYELNTGRVLLQDGDTINILKYLGFTTNTVNLSNYTPVDTKLVSIAKLAWLMDYIEGLPEGIDRAKAAAAVAIIVHDSELEMNPFRVDLSYHDNDYKLYESTTWEVDNMIKKISAAGVYANEQDRSGLYAELDALGQANKGPYGLVVNPIVQVGDTPVANFSYKVWNQGNPATTYVTNREQITATITGPATFDNGSKTKTVNVGTQFGPLTLTGNGKITINLTTTRFSGSTIYRFYDGDTQTMVAKGLDGTALSGTVSTDAALTGKGKIKVKKVGVDTQTPYNGEYAYQGAQFGIYGSREDAQNKTNVLQVLTTGATGETPESNELGSNQTYYIRELVAPKGHQLSDAIKEVFLTALTGTNTVVMAEYPDNEQYGKINLKKLAKDADGKGLNVLNPSYSLAGAVYGVYTTAAATKLAKDKAGNDATLTTDANGNASSSQLILGDYFIKEIKASPGFLLDTTVYPVSIKTDDRTLDIVTIGQTVPEQEQYGRIELDKKAEYASLAGDKVFNDNYSLDGAEYTVFTDAAATIQARDKDNNLVKLTTANGGYAIFSELLLGTYYVKETKASAGFLIDPTIYKVEIKSTDQTTPVFEVNQSVTETEVFGKTILNKIDAETGNITQGKASLQGAKYGLYYADGTKVLWNAKFAPTLLNGTKVTTTDNSIVLETSKDTDNLYKVGVGHLALGDYYWQEIEASEGMQLDATKHPISLTYADQNTPVVVANTTSQEKIIKLKIKGKKELEKALGETVINQNNANGIEFTLTPKAGTNAPVQKTVTATYNDQEGYFTFDMPYGDYTLTESKGKEGYYDINPIAITMTDKGATIQVKIVDSVTGHLYHEADYTQAEIDAMSDPILIPKIITVEDALVKAKLRLEKLDAETGKKIPLAGVQFKIWDIQEGQYITQIDPENANQTTTIFKTNASGEIFLQKELTYGKDRYRMSEVTAPENYELNLNDLIFSVDERTIVIETISGDKVPVITVQFKDTPAKSYISLTKYFESLMGIAGEAGNWNFVWNHIRGWEGATFDVYVANDITEADGTTIRVAPDGTKFSKDTKVATVQTDALGVAKTDSTLYVGDYYLVETKAPAGQHFDPSVKIPVSITYNGKDYIGVAGVVERFDNDRQTVKVLLPKVEEIVTGLDGNNQPIIGKQPGANKTFGLYNQDPIMGYPNGRNPLLPNQGLAVILKPNSLIRNYTTNAAGLIDINQKLPAGEYYFQESNAGENFVLNTTKYYFKVADTNNDAEVTLDLYQKDADGNKIALTEILNQLNPPKIGTTATDAEDGDKQLSPEKQVTIHDEMTYENLFTDREYTVTGTLMDKATGQALKDASGQNITVTKTFTPATPNGSIGLDFVLDATNLVNKDVVVFESLKETAVDKEIAAHRDIDDEGQTVEIEDKPKIGTKATDSQTGDNISLADEKVTIVDTVSYQRLLPEKTYELKGTLMNKATGQALEDKSGKPITATKTFTTPKAKAGETTVSGTVDVTFTLNASDLAGETIVAFEELYRDNLEVATHADINDKEQAIHFPKIGTTAIDEEDADKRLSPEKEVTITDEVAYDNLIPGKTYTVTGTLMDKVTNQALKDKNDKTITVTKTFTPTKSSGKISLDFVIDARNLAKKEIVVFEKITQDKDGVKVVVAVHEEINDAGQTVEFEEKPEIGTKAIDSETGDNISLADEKVTITDTVSYKHLLPEKTYELKGTLMNKATGKPLTDKDGKAITATKTFTTPKAKAGETTVSGTEKMTFTLNASDLAGETIVAFEELYRNNLEVAIHADINDKEQTVYFPEIGTTATDKEDGDKQLSPEKKVTITDEVAYDNLIPGKTYTVTGTLIVKEVTEDPTTGLVTDAHHPLKDGEGKDVTVSKTFTPTKSSGKISLDFVIDASNLANRTLVVFEKIVQHIGDVKVVVAVHEDINDKGQTVEFEEKPEIGTKATDSQTGDNISLADEKVTIIDTVSYKHLLSEKTYELKGTLMNKATGKPLTDKDGKPITATKTFTTPKAKTGETTVSGTVDVTFTLNASDLAGETIVAFEELYRNNLEVATHADINDKEQTVYFPEIGTTATNKEDGSQVISSEADVTIVDEVAYDNLIPGKTYTLTATLMDKATQKPLLVNGKPIVVTSQLTPKTAKGTHSVPITFDASVLKGKTIVVFEDLTLGDKTVAVHHDINDEGQTVTVPDSKITTTAIDLEDGDKHLTAKGNVTIQDKVTYEGLIPSKAYELRGVLMDKATNQPLLINGQQVTATKKFKAETASGFEFLTFTFDASALQGKTIVVFETLYRNNKLVTSHTDINDVNQTVDVPDEKGKLPTTDEPRPTTPSQKGFLPTTGETAFAIRFFLSLLVVLGVLMAWLKFNSAGKSFKHEK
ncbi:hypothetical protein RyT2_21900 [Pseudolactococcus yaeyamensis]